jgi:hypothetical protein
VNRLKHMVGGAPEPERPDDYWEIEFRHERFVVSRETAAEVQLKLSRRPQPRWVEFHDLYGARHWLVAAAVTRISESTVAQRAAERAFERARWKERKAERSWDDDEFLP